MSTVENIIIRPDVPVMPEQDMDHVMSEQVVTAQQMGEVQANLVETMTPKQITEELGKVAQKIDSLNTKLEEMRQSGTLTENDLKSIFDGLTEALSRQELLQQQAAEHSQEQGSLPVTSPSPQATPVNGAPEQGSEGDLAGRIAVLENELKSARARATRLEVLVRDFPDLLLYQDLIPEHEDPEVVRSACTRLRQIRSQDIEMSRAEAVASLRRQSGSIPAQPETAVPDPKSIDAFLREAMDDPAEFRRREAVVLQQLRSLSAQPLRQS